MQLVGYTTMCFPIGTTGIWECVPIPEFVNDIVYTKPPGPHNFAELELASTILSLVEYLNPVVNDKEFTTALTNFAHGYIKKVQEQLPQGVKVSRRSRAMEQTV